MTPITDTELEDLEKNHAGRIRLFQAPTAPGDDPEWQLVLRKPNGKEAQNFRLAANSESRKAFASLDIVKATCVWPTSKDFTALLDEFGFMPEGITSDTDENSWRAWVGLEAGASRKK